MENIFKKLNTNKKLGLFAVAIGFFAVFIGTPDNNVKATVNIKELSLLTENQVDKVSPAELADWIIKGNADFRLLDVRSEKEYKKYHIPVAENIPGADLYKTNFLPTEKLIICGNDGVQTAQGWFLLKARNFKSVYVLDGGIKNWEDEILFPKIPDNPTPEQKKEFDKIKEVSKFFGGTPMTGDSEPSQMKSVKMPEIKLPAVVPGATKKKSKREGC
jgi:rhodanese-related sulfurtransferase